MPTISISVKDKIATRTSAEMYVCGNSDFIISFSFDAEWDGYDAKTARFKYNSKYQDVVFTGSECPVPIITNTNTFKVGVYAGDLHTTTPAVVMAQKSILCGDGTHENPPLDVYNQIMELIGKGANDEEIAAAVEQYMKEHPPESYKAGNNISIRDGVISVVTTNDAEKDNTLPITSAGVYIQIGNIDALLSTI